MLEDLGSYRENNRLEAKKAHGGLPKSIWETYSAFANTAGGVILLGVEELPDHSLNAVGVQDPQKLLDDFWNTVNNPKSVNSVVLSDADTKVHELNGKQIVIIHVPRASRKAKPVYLHENPLHAFRRNHTGDYRCTIDEVRSMMRDAADDAQDSKPLPRVRMNELCDETVRSYRNLYNIGHDGHPWTKLSNDEFLRAIGAAAIAEDGELHPTGAGLLMFGWDWRISEEFPNYFLDYRQQTSPHERWQDRVTSQTGDWSGNVFDFYYRAYNLARQALKVPFRLEGIRRIDDTPAHRALREALANCLTNANYHGRRGVVIVWQPDCITVANPGDFRVDLERAKRGGESDPRNANMLRIFANVDVGERAGSGIPRIIDGWTSCGYAEPIWNEQFDPDRTVLTLPLATEGGNSGEFLTHGTTSNIRLKTFANLDEREKIAVKLAAENGKVTRKDLEQTAGISHTTARKTLKGLVDKQILQWVGSHEKDAHQYYRLSN